MKTQTFKKGSAMVTTIIVMLVVCILVTMMLTLSMYDQSMSKTAALVATRQNRLDMLTDLFLKYCNVPAENFGYQIDVYYYESGSAVMTVRQDKNSVLCDMIVEQRNGELIRRVYNEPYEHRTDVPDRTISVHNEQDSKPYLKLTLPKADVSSDGPFYVFGKIKLQRAMPIGNGNIDAFVNMAGDGKSERTVMRLTANTDGWVDLQNADGSVLKFNKIPSSALEFLFGLNKTSGELTISNLVVVNSKGKVVYSLANDSFLLSAGDVRQVNRNTSFYAASNYKWSYHYTTSNKYTTSFPIVTRDPDSYMPKRVLQMNQSNYVCDGEASLCLYKYGILQAGGSGGFYYITGRVRITITGKAEVCDQAGDSPVAQFHDVHAQYDRNPATDVEMFESNHPYSVNQSLSFNTTGSWVPLLCQDGSYYKFYVPSDCERLGEDYLKFTLWASQGIIELADIRVYKTSQNGTPNPATDTLVYNMETDNLLGNASYDNCALGDERIITDIWRLHWFAYSENANYAKFPFVSDGQVGSWKSYSIVNPLTIEHIKEQDYDLPVFPNKIGSIYQPNAG